MLTFFISDNYVCDIGLTLEQKSCSSSLNLGERGLFNAGLNVEFDSNARLGTVMVTLLAVTTLTLLILPSEIKTDS